MFRNDRLTIYRNVYQVIEGEAVWSKEPEKIAENLPCHLSVSLNNTTDENHIPILKSDFTIFLDNKINLNIKENDILSVKTPSNQTYRLYAGEIKQYSMTIQIRCRQEKIIES